MSILITGGAGYIGSHTAVELLEAGFSVVSADNYSNSTPEALRRVEKITGKSVAAYNADVRDKAALDRIFNENTIDAVIHFAGLKAVGQSVEDPLLYYRVNLDAAISVLEAMKTHRVNRFVFSSSATVYGCNNPVPYTETMPAGGCVNPYGRTKLMIEQILLDSAAAYGMNTVILRYFNPIGAHPSGLLGEAPQGVPNNIMPYITQVAVGKREKLYVMGNDYPTRDGTGVRDYLHVVDLAKGHIKALEYTEKYSGAEIFNLGTGRGTSVLELVEAFERVNGLRLPYVFTERRDGDLDEYWADPSKAEKILGWKAELSVEDMCRDSYNWQIKNPDGYK